MILNGTETRPIAKKHISSKVQGFLSVCVCLAWKRCSVTSLAIQFHTKSDFGLFVVKIKRRFMIYRHKYIHVYVYVWLY